MQYVLEFGLGRLARTEMHSFGEILSFLTMVAFSLFALGTAITVGEFSVYGRDLLSVMFVTDVTKSLALNLEIYSQMLLVLIFYVVIAFIVRKQWYGGGSNRRPINRLEEKFSGYQKSTQFWISFTLPLASLACLLYLVFLQSDQLSGLSWSELKRVAIFFLVIGSLSIISAYWTAAWARLLAAATLLVMIALFFNAGKQEAYYKLSDRSPRYILATQDMTYRDAKLLFSSANGVLVHLDDAVFAFERSQIK